MSIPSYGEPWTSGLAGKSNIVKLSDGNILPVALAHNLDVRDRIVACVNALAGRDPEKLAELESRIDYAEEHDLLALVDAFFAKHEDSDYSKQLRRDVADWYHGCRASLAAFRGETP